jgi:hypothetical protein
MNKGKDRGITLIALVITIIVLLILAGVAITTLAGDNGLLTKAGKSKLENEIGLEKEILALSFTQARTNIENVLNRDNLQDALNSNSKQGNKANITEEDDEGYIVKFDSERYYEVNKNGIIEYIEDFTGAKELTVQCVDSKNNTLAEYKYNILKNRYSKKSPIIAGYEAKDEMLEGEIIENKTIKAKYYLVCNDENTIEFYGVDLNGNKTTNKDQIIKYTVSRLVNNIDVEYVLYIPDEYEGCPVTYIKRSNFEQSKIKKLILGSNLSSIERCCFNACNKLEEVIVKCEDGINLGEGCFGGCILLSELNIFSKSISGSLGDAFQNCQALKKIKINEGNELLTAGEDGIVYSKDLTKLVLYPSAREESFEFPDSVTTIGVGAFGQQLKLTDIEIPERITNIGNFTFLGSKIKNVVNKGSKISEGMFRGCTDLEKIVIGKNVSFIGRLAFYQDSKLKDITYEGTVNEWNQMNKSSEWKTGISNITIKCSDGDIHYN